MSHKSGHIIITSSAPIGEAAAADVVGSTSVELNFPAGMSIDDRIKKVRQVMHMVDKLEHDED